MDGSKKILIISNDKSNPLLVGRYERYINPQPSFFSTAATLLINSISSLAFCNFGKACYWEKSLNIGKPPFSPGAMFRGQGTKGAYPKKTTSDDWLKEQEIQHPILSLESECFKFFRMFWCDNQHERKWNPRKSTGFWWPKVGSGTKNCSRQNPKFFEVAETKTLGTHTFRLISAWEMINDQVMKQISWQKSPQR